MTKISSTMLSVGTLLRRAEDTGAAVRVLVQGTWLDGRVLGCDGTKRHAHDGVRAGRKDMHFTVLYQGT